MRKVILNLITMEEICVPDNNTVSTNKHLFNTTLLIVLNLGKKNIFHM